MDLSSHYLLEVERLGAPYRIIWTRDEGCVDRPIITPRKRRSKHVRAMKLPDADALTDSFRARCAALPPLLPPQAPSLARSTYQMSHSEWLAILDDKHPVVDLAHSLCLPRGELKEKLSSMVAERFEMHSGLKAEAQKMLNSYLHQRTHAAEHYAKLIDRNGRYRRFRHANSLSKRQPTVLNLMPPRNLPLSSIFTGKTW